MCLSLTFDRYTIHVVNGIATLSDNVERRQMEIPVVKLAELFRRGMAQHRAENRALPHEEPWQKRLERELSA